MTIPRPGSLRFKDPNTGAWVEVGPHNPMYSTATMIATEYWNAEAQEWLPIFDDPQQEDA